MDLSKLMEILKKDIPFSSLLSVILTSKDYTGSNSCSILGKSTLSLPLTDNFIFSYIIPIYN